MNTRVSVMQGRLLPPYNSQIQAYPAFNWRDEFAIAKKLGIYSIEWIYEKANEKKNALATDGGINEIMKIIKSTGINVKSVCADYYMTEKLIANGLVHHNNWLHLAWLCKQAKKLGIEYIILPFVDASSLCTSEEREALIDALSDFFKKNKNLNIEIHLETDLKPENLHAILSQVNHAKLKVNYDIGNSASLGYEPEDELSTIGRFLGSVHIKDRVLNGASVKLGRGNADFEKCFSWFEKLDFSRWYVLQASRSKPGTEFDNIKQQLEFLNQYVN